MSVVPAIPRGPIAKRRDRSWLSSTTTLCRTRLDARRGQQRWKVRSDLDSERPISDHIALSWVSQAAGGLLVLAVLREVFHTIFHPAGQGTLAMVVFRTIWRLSGRSGRPTRSLAGPASMVLVIVLWTAGLVLGWTLIYWAALPGDFIFAAPLDPDEQGGFLDALYFAMVTQSTLGFGDIAPQADTLRLLAPLQATIGFGLFTAAVTWVLSVYPALQRQRAAASTAHAIRTAHGASAGVEATTLARRAERLADAVSASRVDYVQFPSTFYFAAPASSLSLADVVPFVSQLARDRGVDEQSAAAATELAAALDLFAVEVARQFLAMDGAETSDILRAYCRHHGVPAGDQ